MDAISKNNRNPQLVRGLFYRISNLKKVFVLSLSLFTFSLGWGQSDLIISQYIETNSGTNPKGIEIFNVTSGAIDFSVNNLEIYQGTNGASCTSLISVTSGTLEVNEVWVIGTSNLTDFANTNGNNLSGTTVYNFVFNGDDALQLYLGAVIQDEFGLCGTDPGSSWSEGGVSTANNNIQIKDGICNGDTDGWTDPSIRFVQIANGSTMNGFGDAPPSCNSSTPTITTTPTSLTGFTYVQGSGPSAEQSFNVEGANLTNDITITPCTNWEIATVTGGPFQTTAIALTQSGGTVNSTTIYTRMVSGLLQANSPFSGYITCTSTGATTQNVAVDGTVTFSNTSDIIANSGFNYTLNIPYINHQDSPITNTSGSVGVFKFDIRDGGGSTDADALGTELTDITFDVGTTHINYIRNAALFDVGAMRNNTPSIDTGAGTITFSGLSGADFTAPDNGTKSLTLRVSFTTSVVDNQQLQFTISSATANPSGSVFGSTNAGGATSSTTGDRNRIEVTATALNYGQQPSDTNTNATMSPAVTVQAVDINNNVDLDFNSGIQITSTGTLIGSLVTAIATSGIATYNSLTHTVAGTGLTLNAEREGSLDWDIISDAFDITAFTFESGDFRPKYATTFANNGDWEYYDGSTWGNVPDGNAPQNTSTTINRILIDEFVNGSGSASNNYNCDIIIQSGGTLEIVDNDSPPVATEFLSAGNTLEVENGGSLIIRGDIDLNSTTNFILRNGAEMIIDQNSMVNNHPMWDGIELFEGGSTVEIRDWKWTASPIVRSLINVAPAISNNANGYKFGKIYFNPTAMTDDWTIVGGELNVNITENDFQINNGSLNYVSVMSNKKSGNSATFGADLVVDDGLFAFGSSYTTDNTYDQTITIKGNLLVGSDDDLYIHKTFNGTPTITAGNGQIKIEGNVEVWQRGANILTSDVNTKQIVMTGNNTHTLYTDRDCSNMPLIIEGGDTAELVDADLKFTGNSSLTVQNGATFNFGFDGTTPLEVQNVSGSSNKFIQEGGAYLYITHPQGIWDASANGNVQSFSASNTTFTQSGSTYHYIGKENQETGDAFTSGSTSKTIICELENNSDKLTVTSSTGTSSLLEIRKGIVVNTEANHIFGSGNLTIADGGLKTSVITGNVPLLSGTYSFTGGFIELNAAGNQTLKGGFAYRDLIFSVSGTKTTTSGIATIDGTILIQDAAILDVSNHTMGGGVSTHITMTGTSEYRTAGINVKPDAQGTYSLGVGTKMSFYNNNATLQGIRLARDYYNIDVEGTNVGTSSLATPIRIQSGGTFTVKTGATFKHNNTSGFSFNGDTTTAIDDTNNPTIVLESGSTIEYAGANQSITTVEATDPKYKNLAISGTGIKTLRTPLDVEVDENLLIKASKLQIKAGEALLVTNKIDNDDELEVLHKGSLVQVNDIQNDEGGIYKIYKTTRAYVDYDYTYWSSPVDNETIGSVFAANPSNYIFSFVTANYEDRFDGNYPQTTGTSDYFDDNGDDWKFESGTEVMQKAKGYVAMGAGSAFPVVLPPVGTQTQSVVFDGGKVNNGDITIEISKDYYNIQGHTGADSYNQNGNLIGNPYPSAIDLELLRNDIDNQSGGNPIIGSTVLFWSHDTAMGSGGNVGPYTYNFAYSDYANFNISTGTGTAAHVGSPTPTKYLASCQSVFVDAIISSGNTVDLHFKNSMRVKGDNDNFFKAEPNRDKIWLNMFGGGDGLFRQIALVFMEGADDSINDYDSKRAPLVGEHDFYSLAPNQEERLVIQGIAPFMDNKIIPLGMEMITSGTYSINIDHVEGVFETEQDIYLKDYQTNILHNLSQDGKYVFTIYGEELGVINNRFELRFAANTTGIDDEWIQTLNIYPNPSQNIFNISWGGQANANIRVFDLTGKLITTNEVQTHSNHYQLDLSAYAKGIYFARIEIDGQPVVKKLILR